MKWMPGLGLLEKNFLKICHNYSQKTQFSEGMDTRITIRQTAIHDNILKLKFWLALFTAFALLHFYLDHDRK